MKNGAVVERTRVGDAVKNIKKMKHCLRAQKLDRDGGGGEEEEVYDK